ncbi:hypothetical protein C8R44DRAFT_745804 [Mycena epipterygia]|nr:hypothetical protein C8R44DRAFT_745804 [Mycena epipterygia]
MEDACLLPYLQLLADGDLTEIGEKGINLSGGQKQWHRKALFHSAIQGLVAQGKTGILVTHALNFLSQCDYIYTPRSGVRRCGGAGGRGRRRLTTGAGSLGRGREGEVRRGGTGKFEASHYWWRCMERVWILFEGGQGLADGILFGALIQGSQVVNSYSLVWWEDKRVFEKPGSSSGSLSAVAALSSRHSHFTKCYMRSSGFLSRYPMGRIISIPLIIRSQSLQKFSSCSASANSPRLPRQRLGDEAARLLRMRMSEFPTGVGLPTIRSYEEIPRFIRDNKYYIDLESRALFYLFIFNGHESTLSKNGTPIGIVTRIFVCRWLTVRKYLPRRTKVGEDALGSIHNTQYTQNMREPLGNESREILRFQVGDRAEIFLLGYDRASTQGTEEEEDS